MSDKPYSRIVSLVPSLTELIIDLGLSNQLVGRTRFCIYPKEIVSEIEIVGGTKNPDLEKIKELHPHLIIANKEENRKEDIDSLSRSCEILLTEIDTIENALIEILRIGEKTGTKDKARELTSSIEDILSNAGNMKPVAAAYFIWKDPWMSVGHDTYIHDVLNTFSIKNIFQEKTRYPEIDPNELSSAEPEYILLSSEPYPFKEKHIQEIRSFQPNAHIELVDGEWFSWYGSRMLKVFPELLSWRQSLTL